MLEEPPKIDRIVSSRGISLSDTAKILTSYLSNIEQFHHESPTASPAVSDSDAGGATNEEGAESADNNNKMSKREEALIAQMDQLVNKNNSTSAGRMISDDIYERLKMITKSICAEVEGKPLSASGVVNKKANDDDDDEDSDVAAESEEAMKVESDNNEGTDDFLAELEEAEKVQQQDEDEDQTEPTSPPEQETPGSSKRDKKKEKKAKKSAKKAKKESKRKAKEMETDAGNVAKKTKVED